MKQESNFQIMGRLILLVKPLIFFMVLAVSAGIAGFLAAIFITILGGFALLDVLGFAVPMAMKSAFITAVLLGLIRGILRYAEQLCNHYIAFKLLALIRSKVFRALRKLCPAKLEVRDKGDLISVITSDIELLEVFYAHTVSPVIIAFFVSLIMTIFIWSYHPLLGLIAAFGYLTVGAVMPIWISKISGDSGQKFRGKSGDLSSFVLESLRGIKECIQYDVGQQKLEELDRRTEELSVEEKSLKRSTAVNIAMTNSVILIFDIVLLSVSYILYLRGQLSFDGILIPMIALMSSFGPVVALANLGSTLQNTFASARRVLAILDESPVTKDVFGEQEIEFQGAAIESMSFSYAGEDILSNINIQMPANRIIGISGKSGSGKSTLLKLMMRFWPVREGSIKISNRDIEKINTDNLRTMQSFMTQETHLFRDSIRSNLQIAKENASEEELITACKKASIHEFIRKLPQGYDTPVGELGDTLSGGEKQRIGLARAFLHDAPLLLLDEPTSNLDSLNEGVILKSLYEERQGKTMVLVSHRASTMRIAEEIYHIENGRMS